MQTIDLSHCRVTVMGLGRFGGGVGVIRYLLQQGARVTLTDLQHEDQLQESLAKIDVTQLARLVLGQHREEDFTQTDLVVTNPGIVSSRNRYLRSAQRAGVPVTTEMNLFWGRCPSKKIVVTGTVGKSTTSTLIDHLLRGTGARCRLGGNIGISLLPEVDALTADDWVVLELSSFQLAYLDALCPAPAITVVTNFFQNHLDWHGEMAAYRTAKQVALKWQTSDGVAILNSDDPDVSQWKTNGRKIEFGTKPAAGSDFVQIADDSLELQFNGQTATLPVSALPVCLRTPHQCANVAAALAAVAVCGELDLSGIKEKLASFQTLPHRLEVIAEHGGIEYINDSKATTPEATMAALSSVSRPVVLIAGGKDKRIDVSELCRSISAKVKAVALIGDTALLMALLLPEYRKGLLYSVHHDLASAFRWSQKQLEAGDTLLLSPGCSSDSQFLNYEDRGNQFRRLVELPQRS